MEAPLRAHCRHPSPGHPALRGGPHLSPRPDRPHPALGAPTPPCTSAPSCTGPRRAPPAPPHPGTNPPSPCSPKRPSALSLRPCPLSRWLPSPAGTLSSPWQGEGPGVTQGCAGLTLCELPPLPCPLPPFLPKVPPSFPRPDLCSGPCPSPTTPHLTQGPAISSPPSGTRLPSQRLLK